MKKVILLFLIGLNFFAFGQKNEFSLSGIVTDCSTKEPIGGVIVKVIGRDKSSFEAKSDSSGYYSFTNCFQRNTAYILSTKVENSTGRGNPIQYGICPYAEYSGKGYFDPVEKFKFNFSDSIKINHDICLSSQMCDMRILPDFYFKKNSLEFSSIHWGAIIAQDTVLDCFAQMLIAQHTWVFEISAHASADEDNKLQLSKDRAKKIYKLLSDRGVEPGKLKSKGFSDKYPIEFRNESGEIIKKSEQETNEKSRRVVLSVLRKDYVPMKDRHNTISGIVKDCKYKIVIPSATIKLVGSDGSSVETKTDSRGYYLFDSSKVNLNTQYVVTTQIGMDVKTSTSPRGYFNSSDKVKLEITSSSDKSTSVEFCLVPNYGCTIYLPTYLFKKNSSEKYVADTNSMSINELYQLLMDNPTFVSEIGSHASKDEVKPQLLAKNRAEKIKSDLIKLGIEPERLVVKSYSDLMPFEKNDENGNLAFEKSNGKNRRVVLSILRKDFISPNAPKEVIKNKIPEEGE